MKHKIITLSAVALTILLACPSLYAGNDNDRRFSKYEINVGWAGYPIVSFPSKVNYLEEILYGEGYLQSIYDGSTSGYGRIYSTGVISAEFNIAIKRWFSMAVQADFVGLWSPDGYYNAGERIGEVNGIKASVIPFARFTYFTRPAVCLYSSVGLGVSASYVSNVKDLGIYPAFQTVPFGVRAGKKVYFMFETGLGTVFCGARAGVGFKF